jgi:hypothetical protein
MDKKLVLAAGLMTLIAGFAEASSCSLSASSCDSPAAVAASTDEASFVSKLNQNHAVAFNLMNAEERLEVLTTAQKGGLAPDAAVENFMTQHHLAVVEGILKKAEVK